MQGKMDLICFAAVFWCSQNACIRIFIVINSNKSDFLSQKKPINSPYFTYFTL